MAFSPKEEDVFRMLFGDATKCNKCGEPSNESVCKVCTNGVGNTEPAKRSQHNGDINQ